ILWFQSLNATDSKLKSVEIKDSQFTDNYLLRNIKILVDAGAKINLADNSSVTRLGIAAENKAPISLLEFLILSEEIIYEPLTGESQRQVDRAMYQLFEEMKILFEAKQGKNSIFNNLPTELINDIIIKRIALITQYN